MTVSDRAGQTFEPDMEESDAPKKKKKKRRICLPTYPYPKVMGRVWASWNIFEDGLREFWVTLKCLLMHDYVTLYNYCNYLNLHSSYIYIFNMETLDQ